MSAEEFIEQYGRIELMKMMKAEEDAGGDVGSRGSGGARQSMAGAAMSMGDMKDMMRGSLLNVKTYETSGARDTVARQSVALTSAQLKASKSPSPGRPSKIGASPGPGARRSAMPGRGGSPQDMGSPKYRR